ncbi:MAG: glycosyltransferase [Chloroflexota bacterium]|nr:glycosyltransferase [Chloroflexota bacterium]
MTNPPRVLVVTYDVIGPKMAGPGIRAWEFARVLGQHFPTTLAAPPPIPVHVEGFTMAELPLEQVEQADLLQLIRAHDIIIAQTLPLHLLPEDALVGKYFVVDLYCPWIIENLEHYRLEDHDDPSWMARDLEAMSGLFSQGDFFVCAGNAQRAYWLGALSLFGRLTEEIYARDADGKALIDIVPFGLSEQPPKKSAPALKGVVPGIGTDDFVALWGGGIWNWLDPLTLIRATARLRDREYPIRTFFLGTQRPSVSEAATIRPTMVDMTRRLSDALHLTDSHVFFNDRWVPYDDRANYLLEADVGLSLHLATLETRFAFRTRVLDYLWSGLVPVVNDGDTIAELVRENNVGRVVAIGDDAALANTIADLIDHPDERRALSARCRELAASHTWEDASKPIVHFCRRPWRAERGERMGAMKVYDELKKMRATVDETSTYAKRLEREVATRDDFNISTQAYIAHLEWHAAARTFRSVLSERIRDTPVERLVALARKVQNMRRK